MVEQQNEFLKQLHSRININVASNAAAATNLNIESATNIIPTKPFNKYRKLLEFDESLRANIAASKQLVGILLIKYIWIILNYNYIKNEVLCYMKYTFLFFV